ncbi:MAG TPA: hypothetical protein VMU59_00005 [Caulobacteraceae bacterium]|nr:hypothetical protein [Caulobacteraceae bacterium]
MRERYEDFGPTLAAEKLAEVHGLPIGVETLRQWMIDDRIWVRRRDRITRIDQGAIVENKRLSEALEPCQAMQAELPPKLRSRKAPARTAHA